MAEDATVSSVAADPADERLIRTHGLGGYAKLFWHRLRGGELGSLPVVLGLVIICSAFYPREPTFLSSRNLVNITLFAAPVGVIALGIALVLLPARSTSRWGRCPASRPRAWRSSPSTRATHSSSASAPRS